MFWICFGSPRDLPAKNERVREQLKLKEGQSFEDAAGFGWSEGNMKYLERRAKYLEEKGWTRSLGRPLQNLNELNNLHHDVFP